MASPPHPCKVLGFHPKPHKFFEKNLTKNFSLSLPNSSAGIKASVSQQTPAPLSAVRDLRTQALGADVRWLSAQARP